MSEYPLIKKLGLDYEETCYPDFGIKLERLLQNATVVYGSIVKHKDEYEWAQEFKQGDTHKALLLAIEPIEQKKVTIRWYGTSNGYYSESVEIEVIK